MVSKMASNPKTRIPPKLERFLLTIARRRNIESVAVALFVFFDGSIVLGADNTLPSKVVGTAGMDATIDAIMCRIGLDGGIRYLGYFDTGKVRQYNFAVDLESKPKLNGEFVLTDAAGAVDFLKRKEAKIIMNSFGRPPVVQQMLIW